MKNSILKRIVYPKFTMQEIKFNDIPQQYQLQKSMIQDLDIKNIYSKFDFFHMNLIIYDNESNFFDETKIIIENYLLNYLKRFKFISYDFTNISEIMNNPELSLKCNSNFSSKIVDVIICVESKCLIIERIDNDIFNNLMNNLTKSGIKVIKASNKAFNDNKDESNEIREEIRNCFEFFQYKIDNFFVKSTFFPIMGYLIGRYYCPTEYFNDPSFFIFKNSSKNNELKTQTIIKNIVFSNPGELDPYEMVKVYTDVKIDSFSYSILNNDSFDPDDFIVLRNIYSNSNASFNLVMHIKSLYLFMVKEIAHPERIEKEFEHEKQFCLFYRHRCINKF